MKNAQQIYKYACRNLQHGFARMMEENKERRGLNRGSGTYKTEQIIEEVMELEESSVKRNKELDISSEFITEIAKSLPLFFSPSQMTMEKLAEQLWKMEKLMETNPLHGLFNIGELEKLYSRDWKYLTQPQKEYLISNYNQDSSGLQQQIERVQIEIDRQGSSQ